eukprot:scaffold245098_cov52-Attheya_sp.AAC.1
MPTSRPLETPIPSPSVGQPTGAVVLHVQPLSQAILLLKLTERNVAPGSWKTRLMWLGMAKSMLGSLAVATTSTGPSTELTSWVAGSYVMGTSPPFITKHRCPTSGQVKYPPMALQVLSIDAATTEAEIRRTTGVESFILLLFCVAM